MNTMLTYCVGCIVCIVYWGIMIECEYNVDTLCFEEELLNINIIMDKQV